ncbi:MAG: DUF1330 domain-containing protein [Thermodesulfobacteriota bacterium]
MGAVHPTKEQIKALSAAAADEPVVMINLLRFKKEGPGAEKNGSDLYDRYAENILPILKSIGARVLWVGDVSQVFIGGDEDRWDRVLLVEYPSRRKFLEMIALPEYQRIHQDREAALESSALLAAASLYPPPTRLR